MRAIWLEKHTEAGEITVRNVDKPSVERGGVLVEIHAAGVNPSDVKYAAGVVPATPLPRIPGRDFAGVMVEGPADQIGKEVYGTGGDLGIRRNGTHADYISLPLGSYALKPANLSMAEAASVGVPYLAAYKALIDLANLRSGETILLLGGSGAVGTAAAQIAKTLGARVISTRRPDDPDGLWREFTDTIITVPGDDITEVVKSATDGKGAQVVFNAVGGVVFDAGVQSLAHGGRMVCIAASGEHKVSFDLMDFYKREMHWHGLDTLELTTADCAPILDGLRSGFESGAFKLQTGRTLPLEQAREAYQLVAKGGSGKVVLTMK